MGAAEGALVVGAAEGTLVGEGVTGALVGGRVGAQLPHTTKHVWFTYAWLHWELGI